MEKLRLSETEPNLDRSLEGAAASNSATAVNNTNEEVIENSNTENNHNSMELLDASNSTEASAMCAHNNAEEAPISNTVAINESITLEEAHNNNTEMQDLMQIDATFACSVISDVSRLEPTGPATEMNADETHSSRQPEAEAIEMLEVEREAETNEMEQCAPPADFREDQEAEEAEQQNNDAMEMVREAEAEVVEMQSDNDEVEQQDDAVNDVDEPQIVVREDGLELGEEDLAFNIVNNIAADDDDDDDDYDDDLEPPRERSNDDYIDMFRIDALFDPRSTRPLRSQELAQIRRALMVIDRHRVLRNNRGVNGNAPPPGPTTAEAGSVDETIDGNARRFDTNLAAEHSYFGENMERVSGVEYFDVGTEHTMMLFLHQHIVYPGEVLPFMICQGVSSSLVEATDGMLFGICFPFMRSRKWRSAMFGVTCQIYEKGLDEHGNIVVKSRALQRFITTGDRQAIQHLEYLNGHRRITNGRVKILPEIYLREPLNCINMGSFNRFRGIASMEKQFKRYQAATTNWPAHVYELYSITAILEKTRELLARYKIETVPTDPVQLSFWLARNLNLTEEQMGKVFGTDTVNVRLRLIESSLKEVSIFVCRICSHRIANCSDLFAMSKHGVQTQYCNSAGHIHETNTVYRLLDSAVIYSGQPSRDFSWFPGYQWHIIVCRMCTRHIGWEFKAIESDLLPNVFFGLASSSVRVCDANGEPAQPRIEMFRNFIRTSRTEPLPLEE